MGQEGSKPINGQFQKQLNIPGFDNSVTVLTAVPQDKQLNIPGFDNTVTTLHAVPQDSNPVPQPQPNSPVAAKEEGKGTSTGTIVLIVIGVALLVVLVGIGVGVFMKSRKENATNGPSPPGSFSSTRGNARNNSGRKVGKVRGGTIGGDAAKETSSRVAK